MDDSQLNRLLRRWGRRLRLVDTPRWAAWGVAAGLTGALILALVARLVPLLMADQLALVATLTAGVSLAVALVTVWLWPHPRHRVAWILDQRLDLAERLTTALEIERRALEAAPAMAAAQREDTLAAASQVDVRTALPLQVPRRPLLAVVILGGGLVISLLLPNPQEAVLLHQAAVRAAIEEQIEELEAVHEEVTGAEALTDEEREALLEALGEAIAALEEGQTTPEEAVSALAEAERSLAELQDPELADLRAGLERAAGEMSDSELMRALSEALARGDYQAAAQELAAFAGQEGQELTRDQELELAQELAQAAEALAGTDPDLAQQLAEAAQAIEEGDIEQAQQAIQEAAGEMAQAGAEIEGQEAVEEALAALQEGREEVAQAGGAGSQTGEQAASAGDQGEQAGQGGQAAGEGQQTQPGHSEDAGTGAPYDEVYVPERLKGEGSGVDIGREGEDGLPTGDAPLPVPEGGGAGVPYDDVYGEYATEAQAALDGSYIPLGMKQYVRDYFSSLEPDE